MKLKPTGNCYRDLRALLKAGDWKTIVATFDADHVSTIENLDGSVSVDGSITINRQSTPDCLLIDYMRREHAWDDDGNPILEPPLQTTVKVTENPKDWEDRNEFDRDYTLTFDDDAPQDLRDYAEEHLGDWVLTHALLTSDRGQK